MTTATRRRREEDEEHEGGHERWLVTYADMVTLLMVLFIILFSMSTVDQKKFSALKEGLANGFGHSVNILNGSNPQLDDSGSTTPADDLGSSVVQDLPKADQAQVQRVVSQLQQQQQQRALADAQGEVDSLTRIWRQIHAALAKKGLADDVRAQIDDRGLVVSLVSKHIVFQANLASLTPRGTEILDTIAPVLAQLTEPIEVDGHTNQVKVKPKYYATDWDLSSARAVTALRRLNEVDGIPARRLSATGFGHTKPLIDPSEPGSQEINKRVDIIVLSQAPAETRAKFNQVQNSLKPEYNPNPAGVTP